MKEIITKEQIAYQVGHLAYEIDHWCGGKCRRGGEKPLVVIGVLSGAVMFVTDLVRVMQTPTVLGWVRSQTYKGVEKVSEKTRELQLFLDLDIDIQGRRVLVVDDILDTGETLLDVVQFLEKFDPLDIQSAVLLKKPPPVGQPRIDADFYGFTIPNEFVVGYGLDRYGHFRGLPGVWTP